MSYEGVASGSPYKRFSTVTSQSDLSVDVNDGGDLEVTVGNAKGFVTRPAAKILARRLLDAAMQPEQKAMRSSMTPKQHRKAAGLTQSEAAQRVQISRSYLGQIERGEASQVSLEVVRRLAALYDTTVEDLGIKLPN